MSALAIMHYSRVAAGPRAVAVPKLVAPQSGAVTAYPDRKAKRGRLEAKTVLLKEESVARVPERLERRMDNTHFSDLMQAILYTGLAI
jgi:hypothetical protein